jgi:squalene cyclase
MLALAEAGHDDAEWMRSQSAQTHEHFRKLTESLTEGKPIGGGAFTASYGLWALRLAGREPEDTSRAIVEYLLKTQRKDGSWSPVCIRPPSQESEVALAMLALVQMRHHASEAQKPRVAKAEARALAWLGRTKDVRTEDLAFRAWGMHQLGQDAGTARAALVAAQRDDGGWGQGPGRPSDAYATGQALYVLRVTGAEDEACRQAAWWLVRNQLPDGSWKVVTRARPVQREFDNGDPHGKSQFLSVAATSWAAAGLARMARTKASGGP